MKRAISILLALVMILALVACTGNPQTSDNSTPSNTQESASAAEKKFTVGFALNDLDEAQSVIYQHLERFCEEKNIELILANAAGSIDQQLTDIENFTTNKVDIIIVSALDSNAVVDVCNAARAAGIYVIDYVMGISQGSDDYLTKPFRPTILLMKVKALLRRVEMDRGKTAAAEDELRYGDLRYSATENAVFCGSTIVALTQTELRLLSYMMKQPEKAYSREELLSAVWGFDSEVETRVTDETLRRIRKKLLQAGSTVSVSTIWGFGYKLKGAECT